MHEYHFIIGITIAILLGAMSPGPSFLIVAKVAVEKSRWQGVLVALGLGTGAMIFALASSLGLHIVLASVPKVYLALKILGGCYLCYLAWRFWRSAGQGIDENHMMVTEADNHARRGALSAYGTGLLTQLSNPKTAIVLGGIFAAFLPEQIPPYSHAILAGITFSVDFAWYTFVVLALSTRHARAVYFRFKRPISRIASGLMGVIGIKLALVS